MFSFRSLFSFSVYSLIESRLIKDLERKIVREIGCQSNHDNRLLEIKILEKHIKLSQFTLKDIRQYIKNNREFLEKFIIEYFQEKDVKELGIGFTLTFSIYLLYLERGDKELLFYLKQRQLQESKQFLEKLNLTKFKVLSLGSCPPEPGKLT